MEPSHRVVRWGVVSGWPVLALASLAGCALSHEPPADLAGTELASSASLVIDETSLYWIDPGLEAVVRAPRGGGPVERLAAGYPSVYGSIARAAGDVVWVDQSGWLGVMRVPSAGGSAEIIDTVDIGPLFVAADADRVYFAQGETPTSLVEVHLSTGRTRVVAPGVSALGVAADGDHLYATRCRTDGVFRVPRDGGAVEVLGPATMCPITVAVHGDHVYFFDYDERGGGDGFAIFRVAKEGGGDPRRITGTDRVAFAVHRGSVYAALDGALRRVPVEGGPAEIVSTVTVLAGVAVADEAVYWTERDGDGPFALRSAPRSD